MNDESCIFTENPQCVLTRQQVHHPQDYVHVLAILYFWGLGFPGLTSKAKIKSGGTPKASCMMHLTDIL
jgi:hypothetical protein